MTSVVIDASVLIKLFVDQPLSAEAERAIKAIDTILAPDLLLPETGNALWKYIRHGDLSADDANQIMSDILQMPIQFTASQDLIEPALRIAIETDRTVYDSLYLALAVQTATVLVTSDSKLIHTLASTKYANHMQQLRTGS